MLWQVENRYSRHLVLGSGSALSALRGAGHVLQAGGMVSFRGVDNSAAPEILPVLGRRMKIALGAPRNAFRYNAALFAVHCRPDGPGARRLTFTPLGQDPGCSVESVTQEFRQLCERAFSESPELWPVRHRQFLTAPG
ncbi:MAG: hypothetical protein U5R46_19065 [Gammaproteobacteria bacterium]|nr:hypothetical protein [Gammaproteobacteria bacterium]